MHWESDIESRQVIDKEVRLFGGYRKITDLVHQDGIRIGGEKGRRCLSNLQSDVAAESAAGEVSNARYPGMSGAVISHLSERKIARR